MIPTESTNTMDKLYSVRNGNATVTLYDNGQRVVSYDADRLSLDYPLSIDLRISQRCSLGMNPETKRAVCSFCHESAKVDGKIGNYFELINLFKKQVPKELEIAVGLNHIDPETEALLTLLAGEGRVISATVNQRHLKDAAFQTRLKHLLDTKVLKGVGVSYRYISSYPQWLLNNSNFVVQVIVGIDTVKEVLALRKSGVKRINILGEKDFGFNKNKVDTTSLNHSQWYSYIPDILDTFEYVGFDSLGCEQTNVGRFFSKDNLAARGYGLEESFYVDAVSQTYRRSSRHAQAVKWSQSTFKGYYKNYVATI